METERERWRETERRGGDGWRETGRKRKIERHKYKESRRERRVE